METSSSGGIWRDGRDLDSGGIGGTGGIGKINTSNRTKLGCGHAWRASSMSTPVPLKEGFGGGESGAGDNAREIAGGVCGGS